VTQLPITVAEVQVAALAPHEVHVEVPKYPPLHEAQVTVVPERTAEAQVVNLPLL